MPCEKWIRELSDYLDDDLDPQLKRDLEEHVGRCPNCRVIVDTTRLTIRIYRGCEPYPIPSSLHDRLLQAIQRRGSTSGDT
jgi:anti-sigma factor RsiW